MLYGEIHIFDFFSKRTGPNIMDDPYDKGINSWANLGIGPLRVPQGVQNLKTFIFITYSLNVLARF